MEGLALKLARPGLAGDFIGGPTRGFLTAVMGLAGIVLLAACANLGSLFAARTADRTREIAIRMAVGSSRWRILRQLLVEAVVISIFGGACASVLAWMALSGLANWHPPSRFPLKFLVMPQPSLILIAFLISVVAGVLFGLMPLRQIFKTDPNEAIKTGGFQSSTGRRWALRDVLLAAQIALCCVTVTAAFVSLRGLGRALTMDLGFNTKNAICTQFNLSEAAYSSDAAADHFQRQLLERVSEIPGVEAAGYATTTPLDLDTSVADVFSEQTTDFRLSNRAFGVALGAQARQILSAALDRMLIQVGSGSVVGIVLGVAASRLLSAIVYQASTQDPLVIASVVFTTVLTGSLSVAGPVTRLLHVDPANLLREQ